MTGVVQGPYMNWRPPVVWTALVLPVEPDHLLLRDVGGGRLLLPGGPVLDGQTPAEAARHALVGPESEHLVLRPVLVDERQFTRRKVITHTFVSMPITHYASGGMRPSDNRSLPQTIARHQALTLLPARARLRAQLTLVALEIEENVHLEWRARFRPTLPAGHV